MCGEELCELCEGYEGYDKPVYRSLHTHYPLLKSPVLRVPVGSFILGGWRRRGEDKGEEGEWRRRGEEVELGGGRVEVVRSWMGWVERRTEN